MKCLGRFKKARTHSVCCVAINDASVKGHSAIPDVDAAALHLEKETAIQRGDGMVQNLSTHFSGRVAADDARIKIDGA